MFFHRHRLSVFPPFIAVLLICLEAPAQTAPATQSAAIHFKAVVGKEDFACGRSYSGIGTTKSTIQPKDFRLYIHNVRLLDETGKEVPLQLDQDGTWQLDDLALIDFEDARGACGNGTPEINTVAVGVVPSEHQYHGLKFTVGVPFEKNHTDLTKMPSPLNLTSMAWVWNAGRKFIRIEFASTGRPRGNVLHLGSTGCTPNTTKTTVPTSCVNPNRPEISLPDFDPAKDQVVLDLAALLQDSDVDNTPKEFASGCMSSVNNPDCEPLFSNLGLALKGGDPHAQTVFRSKPADLTAALPLGTSRQEASKP